MLNTILLPLDGSRLADRAVPYASALARRAGRRLILVRAAQAHTLPGVDPSDAQIACTSRAEHDLEAAAARLRAEGVEAEAHVYYDDPVHAILDAAHRHQAGLIVMSTHGRSGLGRMVYGSVADNVLRHAEAPVLLLPPTVDQPWPQDRPLTVLVPLDGSELAEEALRSAEILAEVFGARLHLVRIIEPPSYPLYGDGYVYIPYDEDVERTDARLYLQELVDRLTREGKEARKQVAIGRPDLLIPTIAQEQQADVIAMATHGRGGLARLVMGSIATGTLQRTHVPLLLTRPTALEQPLPRPRPALDAVDESPQVQLGLTLSELTLVGQAVESLLLDARREEHITRRLRAILERIHATEIEATSREAIGAQ